MSDRIKALTVFLTEDIKIEDIESIVTSIKMYHGVSSVKENIVSSVDEFARIRVREEMKQKLFDVWNNFGNNK